MTALSNALSRERNNFDLVRLVAAIAVAYGHAFVLQLPDEHHDFVTALLGYDYSGSLGVFAFFLLSGILVTASFDRQRSAARFIALRASRLWPAVAFGSCLVVFVLGPLFTTWPLRDYFASGATWSNLDSLSTILFSQRWRLPGVFDHNHFGNSICEPLWTLCIEVRYYFVVLLAGMLGLLKSRRGMILAVLIGVIPWVVRPHLHPHFEIGFRDLAFKPGGYAFFPEPVFMAGMLLYAWRERVYISGWAAIALFCSWFALRDTGLGQPVFYVAFAWLVLWVGTTPLLHAFVPRNDYSFGIYLFGFPVQQSISHLAPTLDPLVALAIAAPFIFALAFVSWHGVEKPALDWTRRRLGQSRRAARAPDGLRDVAP
jgi:peptidoglycan/LPS O-acetylase OafA/YrhL